MARLVALASDPRRLALRRAGRAVGEPKQEQPGQRHRQGERQAKGAHRSRIR